MKKLLTTLVLLATTSVVLAVPAKKGVWKSITLENGNMVKAQLMGDEFGHSWRTSEGKNYVAADGSYREETVAARQKACLRRAAANEHRASRLSRLTTRGTRGTNDAYLGEKKGLILLVDFPDVKFQEKFDAAFYNNVANTSGYTDDNGFRGSIADYFKDQSHEKFLLTFDVVGPVTVSKEMAYYGKNDEDGNDEHAEDLVVEAVTLAKELVTDWKQYDWNDDGEVDQVMIIYAGEGEADGGADDTIWPHEWELKSAGITPIKVAEDLAVNTYAMANEVVLTYVKGQNVFQTEGIGTICHEFSHCLGLMDMYDISYSGNYGMNSWSLMDSGSYNCNGFVPAGYSSFEKYSIGWLAPVELTETKTVSNLKALTDADEAYIIKNPAYPDEYYLLENRQQKSWDTYIPAAGMLILHVDYDENIWHYNYVNSFNDGSNNYPVNDHQRCTIFHADGVEQTDYLYNKQMEAVENFNAATTSVDKEMYYDEYVKYSTAYDADVAGDVYPQADNNQLTNTSLPRAFLYNSNSDGRKLMNVSITDITQNEDETIGFKFAIDKSGSEEGDNTTYGMGSDVPSAISHVEASGSKKSSAVYTLDGRQAGKSNRGIYIIDGKKFISK